MQILEDPQPTFAACVLRKLIDGQAVESYLASLRDPWKEIGRNITACPKSPTLRTEAFEASLSHLTATGSPDAAHPFNAETANFIRSTVFAADLKADLEQPQDVFDHVPIPPLPKSCQIDPKAGENACLWLDHCYIPFSKRWSPRGYEGFHESCGLWVLATGAARRILVHLGKARYTSLYIALTARTSAYSKSSTAGIALATLKRAELDFLLMPDNSTPQKFLMEMKSSLPEDFAALDEAGKARCLRKTAYAGQRGWHFEEFGQGISAMMRRDGAMSDFRGLLRRFDDTPDRYESGTIGRGNDVVESPCVSLLVNLTPADLAPFAQRGSALWGDGFLARFALVTPPTWARQRGRFPKGERIIPEAIFLPLRQWHQRLGIPQVDLLDEKITGKDGKTMSALRVNVRPVKPTVLELSEEVFEAFYAYDDGLNEVCSHLNTTDLDGNYARFSEKALRIATLFASFANSPKVQFHHWARAQAITEMWRGGLHNLHHQINMPRVSDDLETEERILSILNKLKGATVREIRQYSKLPTQRIYSTLNGLVEAGLAVQEPDGRMIKFRTVDETAL